jgi:hypothetical protein
MAKKNIVCNRSTAIGEGGYVSYTYPVARVPRLQGKLVEQASSEKKKRAGGKKKGETKREKPPNGIHDLPLDSNPTSCSPACPTLWCYTGPSRLL